MTKNASGARANAAPYNRTTMLAAITAILALATFLALATAIAWAFPSAAIIALAGTAIVVIAATATAIVQSRVQQPATEPVSEIPHVDARDAADSANLARARFIADASHDLRQPLHALGLFLDSLERRVTAGEGKAVLAKAREAAAVAGRMFDALIDLTRLDADALIPQIERFELGALLARLEEECRDAGAGADFQIVHSGAWAVGDERLIDQICRALLSKLDGPGPGRVLLGIRRRGGRLWIETHCSRAGGPLSKWDVLRAAASTATPERNAIELDLLVVRRLTDLLGLELRVVTAADRGTVFALNVPQAPRASSPPPLNAVSILLIADDAARRRTAETELGGAGAIVHAACNHEQAEFAARHNRLDLVVTDLALDEASARAMANRLAPSLPCLANRTPPDRLVAAARAALGSRS